LANTAKKLVGFSVSNKVSFYMQLHQSCNKLAGSISTT